MIIDALKGLLFQPEFPGNAVLPAYRLPHIAQAGDCIPPLGTPSSHGHLQSICGAPDSGCGYCRPHAGKSPNDLPLRRSRFEFRSLRWQGSTLPSRQYLGYFMHKIFKGFNLCLHWGTASLHSRLAGLWRSSQFTSCALLVHRWAMLTQWWHWRPRLATRWGALQISCNKYAWVWAHTSWGMQGCDHIYEVCTSRVIRCL